MKDRVQIQRKQSKNSIVSNPLLAASPQSRSVAPASSTNCSGHELNRISLRPQAKLSISQPGDAYEQEADRVAARVMSTSDRALQRQETPQEEEEELQLKPEGQSIVPLLQREEIPTEEEEEEALQMKSEGTPLVQREEIPEEEEEETLQMKAAGSPFVQRVEDGALTVSNDLAQRLQSRRGGGSPLTSEVRGFMEPRFGIDFGDVRVHTDSEAVQMAGGVGAQAFTYGSDVYFGAGKAPGSNELTAHELTHVVQQTGGMDRKCTACEEEEIQGKFLTDRHQLIIQRASMVGALSETACFLMSDEQVYEFFAYGYFSGQPNASKHLIHYRNGNGQVYSENVEALFSANPKIRSRIARLISERVADGETQGTLVGKGVDDGGDPPIRQADYDSEDWRNANGNIDEVRWQLTCEYKPNGYNQVQVTIVDPYTWHPLEERPTQCLHAAFERLKTSGAADYITQGTGTIMLPPAQQSPDRPIESDY